MKKAKISERLSESQVVELVKIYKEYDCLWDVSNANYKNRKARDHAYKEILEKLKIPGLKVADIPQKIKNLRTSYYTELKKMENRNRGGRAPYKPKVAWFSIADEILKTRSQLEWNQHVETTETELEAESSNGKAIKDDTEQTTTQSINSACRSPLLDIGLFQVAPQNSIIPSHLFKVVDPSSWGASHTTFANTRCPLQDSTQPPVETTTFVDKGTNEATLSQTTSISISEPKTKYEEDEFDVYGKYIALSLRPMPEEYSILARVELQKTVAKVQLMALSKEKRSINPEQSGPSTSKMEENTLGELPDNIVEMEEDPYILTVKTEEEDD